MRDKVEAEKMEAEEMDSAMNSCESGVSVKRVAVVTGASKGIGFETAKVLVEDGYTVYGLSRSRVLLEGILWKKCDVTDSESVDRVFSEILEENRKIDVLVCNAGIGISGAAEFVSEEDYRLQTDVNFNGAVLCAQAVIPAMRYAGGGKIIFISSLAAIFPLPFQGFYSATKAALNAFSDSLGIELKPFGIETCAVMLNDVKTEFTENRRKTAAGDEVYGGRIEASVSKMEKSERNGMTPGQVAESVGRILKRRHLPPHKIVGAFNEFLGFLFRILPAGVLMKLLKMIYG